MWHDLEQNSDPWHLLRSGKVTGSAVAKIMANANKAFGEPAKKYAVNIAISTITGRELQGECYNNSHMARGHLQEPIARKLYEDSYFCDVTNGGFFDNGVTGCSPDGMVGDDGMVEIKSVIASQQYKTIQADKPDSAYRWQIAFNLRETGRDWLDYVSYCADFPEDRQLYVKRVYAADLSEEFKMMDARLKEFFKLVDEIKQKVMS